MSLFKERFPKLDGLLEEKKCNAMEIFEAKNGQLTAKDGNIMLHSKYNPEKEAFAFIKDFDGMKYDTAVFLGAGLGYAVIEFAKKNPNASLILVEKDSARFFTALSCLDWSDVFLHEKLVVALDTPLDVLEGMFSSIRADKTFVFRNKSHSAYDDGYFSSVEKIILKSRRKDDVNTNTLEKFSKLWLSNSCRNLNYLGSLQGIQKYFCRGKNLPFTVIAAGPSLEKILPYLSEIKKRSVLVCVDTALHACLRHDVEPDFIILGDPQFYCAKHLDFLSSPSSILLTEIASYPSVFRFNCKRKELFSSMFPIGRYFEKIMGAKGLLQAGGSISTTAWDFARFCGSEKIFIAGMDLGFPGNETHIRGSQFEQKVFAESTRICSIENSNLQSLYGASPYFSTDYNGKKILTDKKMDLFKWWFEVQCRKADAMNAKTFTLTPESQKIDGISYMCMEDFMKLENVLERKKKFFDATCSLPEIAEKDFLLLKKNFFDGLKELGILAKKGVKLCNDGLADRVKLPQIVQKLDELDRMILNSAFKDVTSLVFPTQRQLELLAKDIPNVSQSDRQIYSLRYSKIVYQELFKSVLRYEKFI